MKYGDFLLQAAKIAQQHMGDRGDPRQTHARAAIIASAMLNKTIGYHDVAVIMAAVKMARIGTDPGDPDNYLDGINYLAFAGQFAQESQPVICGVDYGHVDRSVEYPAPDSQPFHNPMMEQIPDKPLKMPEKTPGPTIHIRSTVPGGVPDDARRTPRMPNVRDFSLSPKPDEKPK